MTIKSNAKLVRLHKNGELPRLKKKLAQVKRKLTSLENTKKKFEEDIELLSNVGKVVDGVAMAKGLLRAVISTGRTARTYRNASDPKFFGLYIAAERERFPYYGEEWCGARWKSRNAVLQAALDWIIRGQLPKRNGTDEVVRHP